MILGGSIERILKNYGLIVLDIISTRVLGFALYHDLEILLYLPENYLVNVQNYQDLKNRVHIASNKEDLEAILSLFSENNLMEKKNNDEFKKVYFQKENNQASIANTFNLILGNDSLVNL